MGPESAQERRAPRLGLSQLAALGAAVALAVYASVARAPAPWIDEGVVVTRVSPGTSLADSGVRRGDLIVSWEHASADSPLSHTLESPLDWLHLELSGAATGPIVLNGWRSGHAVRFHVEVDGWDSTALPRLSQRGSRAFLRAEGLLRSGRVAEAAAALEEIASDERERSAARAWLYLELGRLGLEAGESERAEHAFESALAMLDSPASRALALSLEATALSESSNLGDAETTYREALTVADEEGLQLTAAHLHHELGSLALAKERLDAARADYERAIEVRSTLAPRSLALALSLRRLGVVARRQGRLEEAEGVYERAYDLAIEIAPDGDMVGALRHNRSILAVFRGDLRSAEHLARGALNHFLRLERSGWQGSLPHPRAQVLGNLAFIASRTGDLAAAGRYLSESLALNQRYEPGGRGTILNLSDKASLAHRVGDFQEAEQLLEQALVLEKQRAGETHLSALILNRLALVARSRGDSESAESHYLKALDIYEQQAPEATNWGAVATNVGTLALDRNDLERAEDYLGRALSHYERVAPGSLDISEILVRLAEIESRRGRYRAGHALLELALERAATLAPGADEHISAISARGRLERDSGSTEGALPDFERSIRLLEESAGRLAGVRQGSLRAMAAELYRDLLLGYLDTGRTAEAFDVLERFRAGSFLARIAEREAIVEQGLSVELARSRGRVSAEYDRVQSRLASLSAGSDDHQVDQLTSRLQELARERRELIEEIRRDSPRLASIRYPEPLTLDEIARSLPDRTALLAFAVFEGETIVFAWEQGRGLEVNVVDMSERSLREQVQAWRQLVQDSARPTDFAERQRLDLNRLSRKLYTQLVAPLEPVLARGERILVLPDGPLQYLPLGALLRPANPEVENSRPQYLVEWRPIHLAMSGSTYVRNARSNFPAEAPAGTQSLLVAFGDPAFSLRRDGRSPHHDLESLPYTRSEVERVAAQFPAARTLTLLGANASEERARSNTVREARVLHFATHVRLNEHRPLDSAIVLSPPRSRDDGGDNGLLQTWEIFDGLRLRSELVVLSACGSALGDDSGTDGLNGLARAFQYAGARSILASLWSVSDRITPELMEAFYRHLLAGSPKDEALRAAQLELIRRGDRAAAPYYWAAFQLYGARDPLTATENRYSPNDTRSTSPSSSG